MQAVRIALLHYTASPVVGGVERVLGEQARVLARAGHAVRVVAGRGRPSAGAPPFVRVPLADPRHPRVARMQSALGGGIVPASFERLASDVLEQIRTALAGTEVVLAHNVCALDLNLPLTVALQRGSAERGFPRVVAWQHDLAWTSERYLPRLHDGWPWSLLKTAWPGATTVTISEQRRAEWAALTGSDPSTTTVIPNGIDWEDLVAPHAETRRLLADASLMDAELILLTPARVTWRKNLPYAIRVVAAARRLGIDARLVISGPVDPHDARGVEHLAELTSLRAELGVADAVHILAAGSDRPPSDRVMRDLFNAADALLLPSRDEGFGLPILEAAAARMPVFCLDLPSLREIGGSQATYFRVDADPAVAAGAILTRLRGDRAYLLATRIRARHRWSVVYERHLEPLLVKVIADRR